MGNTYYRQVTQWSQGKLNDSNNQQDDVQILTNRLQQCLDDHGDTIPTATALLFTGGGLNTTNPETDPYNLSPQNKGIISHRNDIDVFEFQVSNQSVVVFTVNPAWDAFPETYRSSNLDADIKLYHSDGTLITSVDPFNDTNAILNRTLDVGMYYLAVTGNGTNNRSDHGSLGQYFIKGSLTGIKTLGRPTIDRSSDVGLFIWESSKNTWVANLVSGDTPRVVEVDVSSDQAVSNVVPLSIESNDVFTQLPNSLDLRLNVSAPWMDGFKFTEKASSNTCIETTTTGFPVYIGPNRINMGSNVNLTTLSGC